MPDDTHMDLSERVAALEQMLIERTAERNEALEYQTATSEVLNVISRSTADGNSLAPLAGREPAPDLIRGPG